VIQVDVTPTEFNLTALQPDGTVIDKLTVKR
jgi:hypothetical protein